MTLPALQDIQQDSLAVSVAGALAVANKAALAEGTDIAQSLVTMTEDSPPPDRTWRIHYGPRNFKNRRGGDLIVIVDERAGKAQRIIRGQ
jgi:hypothetical protein